MSEATDQAEREKKPFDAGDPAAVKRMKREAKREDVERNLTLQNIMSTTQGRKWMWWFLGQAGVFQLSFVKDPFVTAFNEGRRNLGNIIFAELHKHCAGDYAKMVNEAEAAKLEQERKDESVS